MNFAVEMCFRCLKHKFQQISAHHFFYRFLESSKRFSQNSPFCLQSRFFMPAKRDLAINVEISTGIVRILKKAEGGGGDQSFYLSRQLTCPLELKELLLTQPLTRRGEFRPII